MSSPHLPVAGLLFLLAGGPAFPQAAETIAALSSPEPALRWRATAALAHAGPKAVPALTKALAGEDPHGREGAARALGRLGKGACSAAPALGRALQDPEALVRERAAEALGLLGPCAQASIPDLALALADPDPYVQGQAAVALGRMGAAAVPALAAVLGSPEPMARLGAATALGRMGEVAAPASPGLAKALGDPDPRVRSGAAIALGEASARAAVPQLREALADADEEVRWAADWALERLGAAPETGAVRVLDALTPALMKELNVPGAALAVVRDRKVAWTGAYGVAQAPGGPAVDGNTRFEACSMSKPVFTHVVLLLAGQGLLDLDRPLSRYLDEPAIPTQEARRAITARMVLAHTTGLPNWRQGGEEREGPLPVKFRPGSRFGYSGEGMYYLQRVVEHLAGEPLELLAERLVFKPLGMDRTSFVWTPALEPHLAAGHKADGTFNVRTRYRHANAAYTLYTTPADYARFLLAYLDPAGAGEAALTPALLKASLAPQVALDAREPVERPGPARGLGVAWGLGWAINTTASGPIYHHSGANGSGFRCFCQFDPARGTGLVIMTNAMSGGDLWTRLVSRVGAMR